MSLASMTGFARRQGERGNRRWTWEISGVNAKGLDIRLRVPPGLDGMETQIRRLVGERLSRGAITVSCHQEVEGDEPSYRLNEPLLAQILALADARVAGAVEKPRLDGLLAIRGVLIPVAETPETEEERAALEAARLDFLIQALDDFAADRREEGRRLGAVLSAHLDHLEQLIAAAAEADSLRPEAMRERLKRQVDELMAALGDHRLSEDRLHQELAILIIKTDVREELDRLRSHIQGARDLISGGEPCGRRLEFLSQELNREANTVCSKSQDIPLTRIGMEMKAVINQFREQVLNVE